MINIKVMNEIWQMILDNDEILIATHIRPDGDTIGTSVALKNIILDNTKNKTVKITGDKYPNFLKFLENNDEVSDEYIQKALNIVVDTSSQARIFDQRVNSKNSIKIDHHHEEDEWLIGIWGDHWPATGQLLVEIVKKMNLKLSKKSKEALFVAIYTDTSGFTQRITNMKETMQSVDYLELSKKEKEAIISKMDILPEQKKHIAKLSKKLLIKNNIAILITKDEVSNDYYRDLVNNLSNQNGFEVCIVAFVNSKYIKGSLRSKGNYDVSKIAKKYNGGGHYSAAGFEVKNKNDLNKMIEEIKGELNG